MEEYSNELKDGASAGLHQAFLVAQMVKKLPAMQETEIPWRREWQPTPVFMPGEYYGQRSLAGYSPWSHKELDMTERLTNSVGFQGVKHQIGDTSKE